MATVTHGGTLPNSSAKSDFYALIDNATVTEIVSADLSATAAVADSKLAQITTASKVSGAALTSLTSVPSAAGGLPPVNRITTPVALTSASTITIADFKAANIYTLTIAHDVTLANPTADGTTGQPFLFIITQESSGAGHTIAFGNKWVTSSEVGDIVLSTAVDKIDMFGGVYDGTKYRIVAFATDVNQAT